MAKTKPIGVRFDEDLLNEFKEKGYATTAQGVLILLEEFYKGTKLTHMVVKEDVVENKKDTTTKAADKKPEIKKPESNGKHKLWKEGDPAEYSTRFYFKYNCDTYEELNQLLNQKK